MCAPTIPEAPPPVGRPTTPSASAATNLQNPLALNLRRLRSQRGGLVNQVRRALAINEQSSPNRTEYEAKVAAAAAPQQTTATSQGTAGPAYSRTNQYGRPSWRRNTQAGLSI